MFVPFYLTVSIAGIVAAIIIPRIYPLSKKKDTYYNGENKKIYSKNYIIRYNYLHINLRELM